MSAAQVGLSGRRLTVHDLVIPSGDYQAVRSKNRPSQETARLRRDRLEQQRIGELLRAHVSDLFNAGKVIPLARGTHQAVMKLLVAHGISRRGAALWVKSWARRPEYCKAMIAREPKRDITGRIVELPSHEDVLRAYKILAEMEPA